MVGTRLALADLRLGIALRGRRPAAPVSADQSASALPGDGAAFRCHRQGGAGAVMMNSTAAHAGQPAGGAAARLAGTGGACVSARADAGGDLSEFALAARPRHRVEIGASAGLGRARPACLRAGARLRRAGRGSGRLASTPPRRGPATRWPLRCVRHAPGGTGRQAVGMPVPFEQWASGAIRLGGRRRQRLTSMST